SIMKDVGHCASEEAKKRGDTKDQTWRVGPDKGVANVVVWLRAPKGQYFKIPDDMKEVKEPAVLDQPFCAFEPHVLVVYPSFFDGKTQKKTGQVLKIVNSAPIPHNTNYKPGEGYDTILNSGGNPLLPPKADQLVTLRASKDKEMGGEEQI